MRRVAMALAASVPAMLAGPATGQGVKARPSPMEAAAALPAEAAGFRRIEIADLEGRPNGAGLGAAVEYRPAAGGAGIATVYVYDRGRADLPEGAYSLALDQELDTALREVEALSEARGYRVAGSRPLADVAGPEGMPALRCLQLDLAFTRGPHADSFLCAGVLRGYFLKLRMTLPAAPGDQSEQRMRGFAQGIVAGPRGA